MEIKLLDRLLSHYNTLRTDADDIATAVSNLWDDIPVVDDYLSVDGDGEERLFVLRECSRDIPGRDAWDDEDNYPDYYLAEVYFDDDGDMIEQELDQWTWFTACGEIID